MNIRNICPAVKGDQLFQLDTAVSIAASTTTTATIVVPTGRGKVIGMCLRVLSATLADLDGVKITVSVDGKELLTNVNPIKWSLFYTGVDNIFGTDIREAAVITVVAVNDAAVIIPMIVETYFGESNTPK